PVRDESPWGRFCWNGSTLTPAGGPRRPGALAARRGVNSLAITERSLPIRTLRRRTARTLGGAATRTAGTAGPAAAPRGTREAAGASLAELLELGLLVLGEDLVKLPVHLLLEVGNLLLLVVGHLQPLLNECRHHLTRGGGAEAEATTRSARLSWEPAALAAFELPAEPTLAAPLGAAGRLAGCRQRQQERGHHRTARDRILPHGNSPGLGWGRRLPATR